MNRYTALNCVFTAVIWCYSLITRH